MKRTVLVSLIALTLACGQDDVTFLDLITLPDNFPPEGIAMGNGTTFYVGSLGVAQGTAGRILVGDLATGQLSELVAASGVPALGMKFDHRSSLLFVCRAAAGRGTVYDTNTRAEVRSYQFADAPTAINDVALTRDAAYFTDSRRARLYRVALGQRGEPASVFTTIPLPADFEWPAGAGSYNPNFNNNGIVATADEEFLIFVHTGKGVLYRMRTSTSQVDRITLSGGDGTEAGNGDGLLLDGRTLYVVKNLQNKIAVIEMSQDYLSGTITRFITEPFVSNPSVRVPTTIGWAGNSQYAAAGGLTNVPPYFVARVRVR